MKNNYTSIKFKQWLDKLQQESWQLELLISGFAILGLATTFEPLRDKIVEAEALEENLYGVIYGLVYSYSIILTINLIIHVILRGLWIGSVGLRYVSGDIDYDTLNYSEKFTKYLKKKVGPFDKYISNLEDLCSIVFATSFIVVFYFLAFFICFTLPIFLVTPILKFELLPKFGRMIILGSTLFIFYFGGIIFFIDFITQGFFKRKKWASKIYFPIYRFFSFITLSFLYRALVYNFLDNKFGKRVLHFLIPLYLVISVLGSFEKVSSNYLVKDSYSSKNFIRKNNYLNNIDENNYIKDIAIENKIINNAYLRIFIVYKSEIEDIIIEKNKDLKPKKDIRGYKQAAFGNVGLNKDRLQLTDSLYVPYLNTFNTIYQLKIDSTNFKSDFIISKINKQLGFETVIPLKNINEGKHLLKVNRINFSEDKKKKEKREFTEKVIEIPFWFYKN